MKILKRCTNALAVFIMSNIYVLLRITDMVIPRLWVTIFSSVYLLIMILPLLGLNNIQSNKIRRCQAGCELLFAFLISTAGSIVLLFLIIFDVVDAHLDSVWNWVLYVLLAVVFEAICFWNGIVRVYISSTQIGIKWRVIGALCGMIPIANLIVLGKILCLATAENKFENDKLILNNQRCMERNALMPDTKGVPVISIGSYLKKGADGRFPLNMTNGFVKWFDGENDGLVGSESFKWA